MRGPVERSLGELLKSLRDRLAPNAQGLSVTYVDDRGMRRLNREHRGINTTTDVLSFPSDPVPGEYQHLGDIVISLPVAEKMAKKLGISRRREVETLIIHGFLHLCGYDHEVDSGEMLKLQAELEKELLESEPLPMILKRGRKAGSKVKVMKDGSRVVVTGRAAKALERREIEKKTKSAGKAGVKTSKPKTVGAAKVAKGDQAPRAKVSKAEVDGKRGPGRPRKVEATAPGSKAPAPRKAPRKKKAVRARSGIIA